MSTTATTVKLSGSIIWSLRCTDDLVRISLTVWQMQTPGSWDLDLFISKLSVINRWLHDDFRIIWYGDFPAVYCNRKYWMEQLWLNYNVQHGFLCKLILLLKSLKSIPFEGYLFLQQRWDLSACTTQVSFTTGSVDVFTLFGSQCVVFKFTYCRFKFTV